MKTTTSVLLAALAAVHIEAFSSAAFSSGQSKISLRQSSTTASTTDDFGSFAASLEESKEEDLLADEQRRNRLEPRTWKDDLDELLDPVTSLEQRQNLFTNLMSKNDDIRESVEKALRDRNIDPILTPTGKKLQDGTRAVARQLTNDILPSLAAQARSPPSIPVQPEDLQKTGTRLFNAISNQVQKNIELLQGDLQDPSRIPQRISEQTNTVVQEASNVLRETPAGLNEPKYTVVSRTNTYEIRDYLSYKVVTTNMAPAGEVYNQDNVVYSGQAFNTLASYIFGTNQESKVLSMTTPVTTTMTGEMRFYLDVDSPPEPMQRDTTNSGFETNQITIEEIPAARLAVRKFPGFCTAGEVARQKETLLASLDLDEVDLDVGHGETVGHVLFQYNPPYTLPVLRRNEIAVPVVDPETAAKETQLQQAWPQDDDSQSVNGDIRPEEEVSPTD